MSEIPDDIREIAKNQCIPIGLDCGNYRSSLESHIATALMAERERCAKIAEGMPWHIYTSPDHVRAMTGIDVAEAIRKETER